MGQRFALCPLHMLTFRGRRNEECGRKTNVSTNIFQYFSDLNWTQRGHTRTHHLNLEPEPMMKASTETIYPISFAMKK